MSQRKTVDLLAESITSPDNDEARLELIKQSEFVGWRQKYVHVQCEVAARRAVDPFRREWQYVDHLESHLANRCSVFSRGFLEIHPRLSISFMRGFLEIVTTDMSTFVDIGPECLSPDIVPFVNRLHLLGDTARVEEFVECPILSRIRHLWFGEALCNDRILESLTTSRYLTSLESLNLRFWGECNDKQLLRNEGGGVTADGAATLASSKCAVGIRELDFSFHDIGSRGVRALVRSQALGLLATLILDSNDVGDDGMSEVFSDSTTFWLGAFSCCDSGLSPRAVANALASERAKTLRSLRLSDNRLGPGSGSIFSGNHALNSLERLYLSNCGLDEQEFTELLRFEGMSRLRTINVDHNRIGGSVASLFDSMIEFDHVSAAGNAICTADFKFKDRPSDSPINGRSINLNDNLLDDEFASVISHKSVFQNVESLNLSANPISDLGAAMIRMSSNLPRLRILSLSKAALSRREQDQLKLRFGDGLILT